MLASSTRVLFTGTTCLCLCFIKVIVLALLKRMLFYYRRVSIFVFFYVLVTAMYA